MALVLTMPAVQDEKGFGVSHWRKNNSPQGSIFSPIRKHVWVKAYANSGQ